MRRMRFWVTVIGLAAISALPAAQPVFTGAEIFPPEEFAARRARVLAQIGDAVAILQGTTERPGEQPLRQNNQFFYLTGVVEPRAIVQIDGRTKNTTLFLQPLNDRREERMFGPGLHPGAEAARATGLDAVLARDEFANVVAACARDGRTIYTPFRPEVLGEASSSDPAALWRATKQDPWDGRVSREEAFITKLQDGDLVQFDYAPDYKYYQSDVTRVFPANGTFSARQRELYTIYLRLYQALMTSIKVHASPRDIVKEAVGRMDAILAGYPFT